MTRCVIFALALLVVGCQEKPKVEPLPKSRDLARPRPTTTAPASNPSQIRRVQTTRLQLRGDVSLEKAWALTVPPVLDAALVALWKSNGVRIAELDAENSAAFSKALPRLLDVEESMVISDGHDVSPISPNRAIHAQGVLVVNSDGSERAVKLPPGIARFLLKVLPDEGGGATIELTPQHYWPKATLKPRSPQETELDGVVFHDLRLEVRLRENHWFVIGLETSLPAPTTTQPAAIGEGPATQPSEEPTTRPEEIRRRQNSLADLLLLTGTPQVPRQVLLLLTVTREAEPTAKRTSAK